MKTGEITALLKIKELHQDAKQTFNGMDVGITLFKMSDQQVDDLNSMIAFFELNDRTAGYILSNVAHDLNGLKAEFISGPCGFSPRSTGYAEKSEAHNDN